MTELLSTHVLAESGTVISSKKSENVPYNSIVKETAKKKLNDK